MRMMTVKGVPGVGVLKPEGRLDVEALRSAVELGRRRGLRSIVLDLSELRYIHSLGISALVALSDAMDGALLLAGATPKVKIIHDLMGLGAALPLYKTVVAAVKRARAAISA